MGKDLWLWFLKTNTGQTHAGWYDDGQRYVIEYECDAFGGRFGVTSTSVIYRVKRPFVHTVAALRFHFGKGHNRNAIYSFFGSFVIHWYSHDFFLLCFLLDFQLGIFKRNTYDHLNISLSQTPQHVSCRFWNTGEWHGLLLKPPHCVVYVHRRRL